MPTYLQPDDISQTKRRNIGDHYAQTKTRSLVLQDKITSSDNSCVLSPAGDPHNLPIGSVQNINSGQIEVLKSTQRDFFGLTGRGQSSNMRPNQSHENFFSNQAINPILPPKIPGQNNGINLRARKCLRKETNGGSGGSNHQQLSQHCRSVSQLITVF